MVHAQASCDLTVLAGFSRQHHEFCSLHVVYFALMSHSVGYVHDGMESKGRERSVKVLGDRGERLLMT